MEQTERREGMSEAKSGIWQALAEAQAELVPAKKDATNPHLGNKYADLASCWEALQDVLPKHGLAVTQIGENMDGHCWLRTTLGHVSGETLTGIVPVVYGDAKGLNIMQAFGSAWTYARRYGLAAICGLTAEDDDAAGAGHPETLKPSIPSHQGERQHVAGNPTQPLQHPMNDSKAETISNLMKDAKYVSSSTGEDITDIIHRWSAFMGKDKNGAPIEKALRTEADMKTASEKWLAAMHSKAKKDVAAVDNGAQMDASAQGQSEDNLPF